MPHVVYCNSRVLTNKKGQIIENAAPAGYGPTEFQTAYGLTSAATQPTDEVVAIVDAFHDPTAKADLDLYSTHSPCRSFRPARGRATRVASARSTRAVEARRRSRTETGRSRSRWMSRPCTRPAPTAGSCSSRRTPTTGSTCTRLRTTRPPTALSCPTLGGGGEYGAEVYDDVHVDHPGVAITVSSGDYGYGVEYPSASQYVTSVGGTTLQLNPDGTRSSERVLAVRERLQRL